MPEPSYEKIEPLVASSEQRSTTMNVVFQCPVTGTEVQSSASIRQGTASRAKSSVKRSLWYSLRSSISYAVRSMVGGGMAGSMAGSAVSGATSRASGGGYSFSEEEKQAAIVDAFGRVAQKFIWDAGSNRYVSAAHLKDLQSEFSQIIASTELSQKWDRAVLARMLAEVAASDGHIAEEEHEIFGAFASDDAGPIRELAQRPPLTAAELGETSASVRDALLMTAAALAYSDEEFQAVEQIKLEGFAQGLGIPDAKVTELTRYAREYVVDTMLESIYADGTADAKERQMVAGLAQKIGVDQASLDRLDVRVRKRKGIV